MFERRQKREQMKIVYTNVGPVSFEVDLLASLDRFDGDISVIIKLLSVYSGILFTIRSRGKTTLASIENLTLALERYH